MERRGDVGEGGACHGKGMLGTRDGVGGVYVYCCSSPSC